MNTTYQSISSIVTQNISLTDLLQQCNTINNYNPITDFQPWADCLNNIQKGQNYKYNALQFTEAITKVWTGNLMNRDTLFKGIQNIKTAQGNQAFDNKSIYKSINTQYPITVTFIVDTKKLISSKQSWANKYLTATDNNGDPNQGSNEITVNANVGNTLRWVGKSKNGTDTVQLTAFVFRGETNLFGENLPSKQSDGSYMGKLVTTGTEVYSFSFTINNVPTTYNWDPYINCSE
ncbi:AidA/PixA family protein [Aquimarina longa]|uniref:AidA/PixA family protein n=1 Tax=Aquimarina longa TaxID=1080221 RepID=UPI000780BB72|nr:AidA/PixA family protein [Aquimarina longa]